MSPLVPKHWPGLGLLALALTAFALVFATSSAGAAETAQRLVVRGQATAVAGPCSAFACPLALDRGRFRGTLGRGAYSGSLKLTIANSFPNGEGGSCAPLTGRIELRTRAADRIGLLVSGDSCQDGPAHSTVRRSPASPASGSRTAPARTPARPAAVWRRSPKTPPSATG